MGGDPRCAHGEVEQFAASRRGSAENWESAIYPHPPALRNSLILNGLGAVFAKQCDSMGVRRGAGDFVGGRHPPPECFWQRVRKVQKILGISPTVNGKECVSD